MAAEGVYSEPACLAADSFVQISLDDDDEDEEEGDMGGVAPLATYDSTCCHGAPFPSDAGAGEWARQAASFAAKRPWAYVGEGSAFSAVRAFDDVPGAVHPQCQLVLQAQSVDALARGAFEEAAERYNAARLVGAAVDAAGGPQILRASLEATDFLASLVEPRAATRCAVLGALRAHAVGVRCACLGGLDLPYARRCREWEARKRLGAERVAAKDYADAREAYEGAYGLLQRMLSRGFCDGGGKKADQVRWLWDEEAVLLANASLCALKSGDAPGALDNAKCAVTRRPTYPKAHARKAAALEALGELDEAHLCYRNAKREATKADDAAAAKVYAAAILRVRRAVDAKRRRADAAAAAAGGGGGGGGGDDAELPPDVATFAYQKGNNPNPPQPEGVPKFDWKYEGPLAEGDFRAAAMRVGPLPGLAKDA